MRSQACSSAGYERKPENPISAQLPSARASETAMLPKAARKRRVMSSQTTSGTISGLMARPDSERQRGHQPAVAEAPHQRRGQHEQELDLPEPERVDHRRQQEDRDEAAASRARRDPRRQHERADQERRQITDATPNGSSPSGIASTAMNGG